MSLPIEHFPTSNTEFLLPAPAGVLEVVATPSKTHNANGVAIICHPHPLHGGSLRNKVVTTLAQAFDLLNLNTVRFNFRGIGKSTGQYGETIGETEDLYTVLNWVKKVVPDLPIWLAGFSFGGYIAATVANQEMTLIKELVTIAPAVNRSDFSKFTAITAPWLIVQGDQDEIVPYLDVKHFALHPPAPVTLLTVNEASHFFHRRLLELRQLLVQHFSAQQLFPKT